MILLDTDHLSVLKYPNNERGVRLNERLRQQPADEVVTVSIISVEEQMRGWLAAIAKERQAKRQVLAYSELALQPMNTHGHQFKYITTTSPDAAAASKKSCSCL